MKRSIFSLVLFIGVILAITSCSDDPVLKRFDGNEIEEPNENYPQLTFEDSTNILIDYFSIDVLETFYVWSDEPGMKEQIESVMNPDTCTHPVAAIKKALYKDDRWTRLISNMTEELESLHGVETTIGLDATPYLLHNTNDVFIVVNFVYANSPASDANIKRGDIFTKMNGKKITTVNYKKFFEISETVELEFGEISQENVLEDTGETITLTPIKMYEEPVIATNIFDIEGKKVGYLAYSEFSDGVESLQKVCTEFKTEGVSELILDLRYNGGGLVTTLNAFASMLAPTEVVENEEIFQRSIYNKVLSEIYKDDMVEIFEKDQLPYNLNLKKIYALVSKYTASASESLIVGLSPYMDIELIGEQTHGKYCTGAFLTPEAVYKSDYYNKYKRVLNNWGIYVMIATFGDKNGYNGSRPDGFIPTLKVKDDQFDGYQLGDPNETMLNVALKVAGLNKKENSSTENAPTRTNLMQKYISLEEERPNYNIIDLNKLSKLKLSR